MISGIHLCRICTQISLPTTNRHTFLYAGCRFLPLSPKTSNIPLFVYNAASVPTFCAISVSMQCLCGLPPLLQSNTSSLQV